MMKKFNLLFILFFMLSFNAFSQGCWYPAIPSYCDWMTDQLDDNTTNKYAVYQANDDCVYIQYDFDFWQENFLVGLKVFIHGGGVYDLVKLYDLCEGYSWNGIPPFNPAYPNAGRYIYYSNQIYDPDAVVVTFIYTEIDWGTCIYKGKIFYDYFGYYASTCTPTAPFQDENNDFGNIETNISLKATGVYPTVVKDKINIIESQEIKNIDIIDISGSIVKKYKSDKYNSGTFNLSDINSGIYILRVTTTDNIRKNYKIIKE